MVLRRLFGKGSGDVHFAGADEPVGRKLKAALTSNGAPAVAGGPQPGQTGARKAKAGGESGGVWGFLSRGDAWAPPRHARKQKKRLLGKAEHTTQEVSWWSGAGAAAAYEHKGEYIDHDVHDWGGAEEGGTVWRDRNQDSNSEWSDDDRHAPVAASPQGERKDRDRPRDPKEPSHLREHERGQAGAVGNDGDSSRPPKAEKRTKPSEKKKKKEKESARGSEKIPSPRPANPWGDSSGDEDAGALRTPPKLASPATSTSPAEFVAAKAGKGSQRAPRKGAKPPAPPEKPVDADPWADSDGSGGAPPAPAKLKRAPGHSSGRPHGGRSHPSGHGSAPAAGSRPQRHAAPEDSRRLKEEEAATVIQRQMRGRLADRHAEATGSRPPQSSKPSSSKRRSSKRGGTSSRNAERRARDL
mmetsp:Transcript_44151/g.127458  ORF Transcript_44151/g.127458 Transcript_44151/m.127458 type:complete len:413 (+) Transcript_44151:137-1375(+)